MDDDLRAAVEDAAATQLDRLGSEKLLIALTDATLEEDAVRAATAAGEREGAAAFRAWADDEGDDAAAAAFDDAATAAAERAERLGDNASTVALFPLDPAAYDGTAERVGAGLVGWPLVQARVHRGAISFFINEADEAAADAFREARSAVEALPAEGEGLLAEPTERERAREAAEAVVDDAYGAYAGALEALGIDPRPIC